MKKVLQAVPRLQRGHDKNVARRGLLAERRRGVQKKKNADRQNWTEKPRSKGAPTNPKKKDGRRLR